MLLWCTEKVAIRHLPNLLLQLKYIIIIVSITLWEKRIQKLETASFSLKFASAMFDMYYTGKANFEGIQDVKTY